MFGHVQIILCAVVLGFYSIQLSAGEVVAISPGESDRISTITDLCPTFSWSQTPGAKRYELAVFEQIEDENIPYETASIDSPVISKILPAPALSWTPSSEVCLIQGVSYIWYVRDLATEQQSGWSKGKRFVVDLISAEPALESAILDALVTYLSDERTLLRVVELLQKEANATYLCGDNLAKARMTATSIGISDKKSNSAGSKVEFDSVTPKVTAGAVKLSPGGVSYFTGGNLGIGTTSPNYKLDVKGDIFVRGVQEPTTAGEAIVYFRHPGHNIRGKYGTGVLISAYNAPNALTVREHSGNVGIGTTSPNYKLDVEGNIFLLGTDGFNAAGEDAIAYFGAPGHNIRGEYGTGILISAHGEPDALTVREVSGNVGIGTTTPIQKLDVAGKIKIGVDSTVYTTSSGSYFEVRGYPITAGGPVCNEATRGSMFVGTVSVRSTDDLLCMCLRRGSEMDWYCFGP